MTAAGRAEHARLMASLEREIRGRGRYVIRPITFTPWTPNTPSSMIGDDGYEWIDDEW